MEEEEEAEPYVSVYRDLVSEWLQLLPLWFYCPTSHQWKRNLTLGDAATPPQIVDTMAGLMRARGLTDEQINAFCTEGFEALFEKCGDGGVPDMRNDEDRFAVLAYARNFFQVNGKKITEYVYVNDKPVFTARHSKTDLNHIADAKVRFCPFCNLVHQLF